MSQATSSAASGPINFGGSGKVSPWLIGFGIAALVLLVWLLKPKSN